MAGMFDGIVFAPGDVDTGRSPLRATVDWPTRVLGAFNPGLIRLANGNLLMMVRVAEALVDPVRGGHVHCLRWDDGRYHVDAWPRDAVALNEPRVIDIRDPDWPVQALTSLSWLLPVELSADGTRVLDVDYGGAIGPSRDAHSYGLEDPRIALIDGVYHLTCCSVGAAQLGSTLFTSPDARVWSCDGLVLDHMNKDMVLFGGRIGGEYWALTRPLGPAWFAYPPGSAWRSGPAIHLARSPDARHWRPCEHPGIRARAGQRAVTRMGGGAPPILTPRGWLALWHGVEPNGSVGTYRTWWCLLDRDEPWRIVAEGQAPVISPRADLVAHLGDDLYLTDISFTTGIVDAGDHYVVAGGEADIACRITHLPKGIFAR